MRQQTEKWLSIARDDAKAAAALAAMELWGLAVHACQQAIEKSIKALIVENTDKPPPRLHDLVKLADMAGLHLSAEQGVKFAELTYLYIGARYPDIEDGDMSAMAEDEVRAYLTFAKETCEWTRAEIASVQP